MFGRILLLSALSSATLWPHTAHAERLLLEYRADAYGLPAGYIRLDLTLDGIGARSSVGLESSGLVDLFAPTALAANSEAILEGARLRQQRFSLDHVYARKRRVTFMEHTAEGLQVLVTPRHGSPGEPRPSREQIEASLDPLGALAGAILQVRQAKRCAGALEVFDGKRHYRLDLEPASSSETARWNGPWPGPALRCSLRYTPLAGYDPEDRHDKLARPSEIWFAFPQGLDTPTPVRARIPLPLGARLEIDLIKASRAEVNVLEDASN